nr:unnamed protein product [Callosobruchus analis]
MAQAYITSYVNDYRRHFQGREPPIYPDDARFDCDEDKDFWMSTKMHEAEDEADLIKGKALLHRMRMGRMISTYRHHYCKERPMREPSDLAIGPDVEDVGFEHALLENCKALFGRRSRKLLPPITTGRHINGYMRTSRFYTPLTVYQRVHGQLAYKVMEQYHQRFENELLESCKLLFGPKTQKLLAPLVTSRHINGYMRSEGFYTPLTIYQKDIGQVAYNVLSNAHK